MHVRLAVWVSNLRLCFCLCVCVRVGGWNLDIFLRYSLFVYVSVSYFSARVPPGITMG